MGVFDLSVHLTENTRTQLPDNHLRYTPTLSVGVVKLLGLMEEKFRKPVSFQEYL